MLRARASKGLCIRRTSRRKGPAASTSRASVGSTAERWRTASSAELTFIISYARPRRQSRRRGRGPRRKFGRKIRIDCGRAFVLGCARGEERCETKGGRGGRGQKR